MGFILCFGVGLLLLSNYRSQRQPKYKTPIIFRSAHSGESARVCYFCKFPALFLFFLIKRFVLPAPAGVVLCLQHQPLSDAHPAGELSLCSEVFPKPGNVARRAKLWRRVTRLAAPVYERGLSSFGSP